VGSDCCAKRGEEKRGRRKKEEENQIEDPLATGQKWHCMCGAKYKATWGVVCEIALTNNQVLYMKAEVPDEHVQDARAVFYEKEYKPLTPEANRQTGRQTDRQTGTQTERKSVSETDGQTDRRTDGRTD
jgi:hypothetical protein